MRMIIIDLYTGSAFLFSVMINIIIIIIIRIIRIVMIMIVDQCNNLPDEERKKVPGSSSGLTWSSIIIITIFISLFLTMIMIVRIIIIFNVSLEYSFLPHSWSG